VLRTSLSANGRSATGTLAVRAILEKAIKNIEDQQCRIVRQRELMAKYERDDDVARLSGARLVLERMEKQLAQMTAAHVAAEEPLAKLSVEIVPEAVVDE
jgi:2-keto-3-deoxy-galactonokinase